MKPYVPQVRSMVVLLVSLTLAAAMRSTLKFDAMPSHQAQTCSATARMRVKLAVALCCVKQASASGVEATEYWAAQREALMSSGSDQSCAAVSDHLHRGELVAKIGWLRQEIRALKQQEHVAAAAAAAAAAATTMTAATMATTSVHGVHDGYNRVQGAIHHLAALEKSGAKMLPPTIAADTLFCQLLESGLKSTADGGSHWEEVQPGLAYLLRLSPNPVSVAEKCCDEHIESLLRNMLQSKSPRGESAALQLKQLGSLPQIEWVVLDALSAVVLKEASLLARAVGGPDFIEWNKWNTLNTIFEVLETLKPGHRKSQKWVAALNESAQLSYAFCSEAPLIASRIWMLAA